MRRTLPGAAGGQQAPEALLSDLADNLDAGFVGFVRAHHGKTQVTIEYDGDDPVRLDTVVMSSQHAAYVDLESLLASDIREFVVEPELKLLADAGISLATDDYRLLVNPTGRFEVGGPMGDAGLTGRKIIIDTYGGMARHRLTVTSAVNCRTSPGSVPITPPRCARPSVSSPSA